MKLKRTQFSSQFLILALAGLVLVLTIQMAKAQSSVPKSSPLLANNANNQQNQAQVLQMGMPQKGIARRLLEDTTLNYYQQFLGPTASGPATETYNPFQEGRAPLQSFHSVNVRHQINVDWAVGASLAVSNGYTEAVETKVGTTSPDTEWYNARAYVTVPSLSTPIGKLFSTFSYEAPTSNLSKENEMRYGVVISESFAFNMPSVAWSFGLTGQYYRSFYKRNTIPPTCSTCTNSFPLQTIIISGGPYLNYRFNDRWMLNSSVVLDWDQRGVQTDTREYNNNLPDRGRVGFSYFPPIKYLSSVGLFTQGALKFRPSTTALGAEMAVKF